MDAGEQRNVALVRSLYEAFGRGDIPGILEGLSEDIEWVQPDAVPWGGTRRGRDEVAGFFQELAEAVSYQEFEPLEFIAQGDRVVVRGRSHGRVLKTGRQVDQTWVMLWSVAGDEVVGYEYLDDTARWVRALEGKP